MKGFAWILLFVVCVASIACGNRKPVPADDATYHYAMRPDFVEPIQADRIFRVVQEPQFNPETGFWKMVVARDDGFEFAVLLPQKGLFPKGAHVRLYMYTYWASDAAPARVFIATN